MTFNDFIASIIERLGARGEVSAAPRSDKSLIDPTVGLAWLELTGSGQAAWAIDGRAVLSHVAAPVIGIVGMNPVGIAVAEFARATLGAEVVFCNVAGEPGDRIGDTWRFVGREEAARTTNILCFPLPGAGDTGDWLLSSWTRPLRARTIIVAWRRSPPVERALAYLAEHIADEVPLPMLAAHVELSKFHLTRLFRATLGITPHRCHLLLRVHQARTMLRQGMRVTEVALALGFFDQAHLDRTFRLFRSDPPSWYQQRANFFQDKASGLS